MKAKRYILLAATILLSFSLTGCKTQPARIPPLLSLDEVLTPYNNNVDNIQPFYANLGKWKSNDGSGSGDKMFYYPPTNDETLPKLFLQFSAPLNKKVTLISDQQCYGMMLDINEKDGYWGYHKNIGKPCSKTMPISISSILETLTLKDIPLDKIMAFKITDDYNIIEYINENDLMLYLHEVSFDRFENIPKRIRIFSVNGQKIIESKLEKFQRIESGPLLPTQIRLDYLPDDIFLELKIKNYKNYNSSKGTLLFKVNMELLRQYQQLDADCLEE